MDFDENGTIQITDTEAREAARPTARAEVDEETYGRVLVEPLPRGLGVTLGSPLRRALYRGLTGYAVRGVFVNGMSHEKGETVPGTDMPVEDFLLNLRSARIAFRGERDLPVRCLGWLRASGANRVLTLGDLEFDLDFETVNPDEYLATLSDSSDAALDVTFWVVLGRGYSEAPADARLDAGQFILDAAYTPVRSATYSVERARVGIRTDFERLALEVRTDGTVRAIDAIKRAAVSVGGGLARVSAALGDVLDVGLEMSREEASDSVEMRTLRRQDSIEKLGLSPRSFNILRRGYVTTVGQLLEWERDHLFSVRGLGTKSYEEIRSALTAGDYLAGVPEGSHWLEE